MKKLFAILILACLVAPTWTPLPAEAGWRGHKGKYSKNRYKKHHAGKRRAQVRGYRSRRGGYSYAAPDVANTYGDSRNRYGSVNSYRDPFSDRQSNAGPFDHGWFFDSAIAPRGGDSPYMH
jgi:hypothetical protein